MKTRYFVVLVVAMLSLLAGGARAGTLIPLPPSGDTTGVTDSDALQAAVENQGSPVDIRLAPGTYYLNKAILMANFHGSIRGAGMDDTLIRLAAEIPVSDACPVWRRPPSKAEPWPYLFEVLGGDVTFSDLAMDVIPRVPAHFFYGECDSAGGPLEFGVLGGFIGVFSPDNNPAQRSLIERVRLTGGNGDLAGFNVVQMTYHEGLVGTHYNIDSGSMGIPLNGVHVIRDSDFSHGIAGNSLANLDNSASVLATGNRYHDLLEGFESLDANGHVTFRGNTVTDSLGVGILAGDGYFHAIAGVPLNHPTELIVENNRFDIGNGFAALDLEDWATILEGTPLLRVTAKGNTFRLKDSQYGVAGYGLRDARFLHNRLEGNVSGDGFALGRSFPAMSCSLVDNDTTALVTGGSAVHLGGLSSDCLVVMDNADNQVYDETDDPGTPDYDGANTVVSTH